MRRYAERTSVPIAQSTSEIRALLEKHGATGFMFGEQADRALVGFVMSNRQIRFVMPILKPKERATEASIKAHAAENRRRWRALLLVLKAKLEAVSGGIVEFEREFLAHIVTDAGVTVGDRILSRLDEVINQSKIPNLLGDGTGAS